MSPGDDCWTDWASYSSCSTRFSNWAGKISRLCPGGSGAESACWRRSSTHCLCSHGGQAGPACPEWTAVCFVSSAAQLPLGPLSSQSQSHSSGPVCSVCWCCCFPSRLQQKTAWQQQPGRRLPTLCCTCGRFSASQEVDSLIPFLCTAWVWFSLPVQSAGTGGPTSSSPSMLRGCGAVVFSLKSITMSLALSTFSSRWFTLISTAQRLILFSSWLQVSGSPSRC